MKKPTLSIITPLHAPGNRYIAETYMTLTAQRNAPPWEWLILENNGGKVPKAIAKDAHVKVITDMGRTIGIGALKKRLCDAAQASITVELDADDLLDATALRAIVDTFADAKIDPDFVYSDCAAFHDKTWAAEWDGYPYGTGWGWGHYPTTFNGHRLVAMRSPEATAHNLRRIEYAPDHVRAWKTATYRDVGGHDATLPVADDHDLMVRFFLAGKRFAHIDRPLYFYRVHDKNTVKTHNAAIQAATEDVYNKNVFALAEKWCDDNNLMKVDLCGAVNAPAGYMPIDRRKAVGNNTGVVCDLSKRWALKTSSVGVLRAYDAIEHLADPIHTMNEAWRVLAPGGWFMISVPSTSGKGAFCDPDHKSWWNDLSFRYYTDKAFATPYAPSFEGQFQLSRVIEWFPSEWHRANNVPYVEAHLFCVKDSFRAMGAWGW